MQSVLFSGHHLNVGVIKRKTRKGWGFILIGCQAQPRRTRHRQMVVSSPVGPHGCAKGDPACKVRIGAPPRGPSGWDLRRWQVCARGGRCRRLCRAGYPGAEGSFR